MSKLRVISDVHGCLDNRKRFQDLPSYMELCEELGEDDYSVQLGDLGFNYDALNKLDSKRHRVILGNHENYDIAFNYQHMYPDYGFAGLGNFEFFFVRGAFSIDKRYRIQNELLTGNKSWWAEEELSYTQSIECLKQYEVFKPEVVMSHDCPASVSTMVGNPGIMQAFGWQPDLITSTQELLEQMLDIHKPKLWVHAHYHVNTNVKYHGTTFMCLAERQYIDFDENWEIVGRTGLTDRASRV